MRKPHFLTASKQGQLPVRLVFFDTETKPVETALPETTDQKLWFGYGAYVRRFDDFIWSEPKWKHFEQPTEFWDWIFELSAEKTALYVFAHNLGFDVSVTKGFDILVNNGWEGEKPILDDPPSVIKYRKNGKTIVLLDTLNFFRVPLWVLGKSVGIEKLEMPQYSDPLEMWETYGHRDVEVILYAIIQWLNFVHNENLGNFAKTLPGQSLQAFRHRFMTHKIYIDSNEDALELARRAFHGGRTECFKLGKFKENVHCVDINSQYPTVMKDNRYPLKLLTRMKKCTPEALQSFIDNGLCVVADVCVETGRPIYPIIRDEKLVFPVGNFVTSLSTPEIAEALSHNEIVQVYEASVYSAAPIFKDYIEYFWAQRKIAQENDDLTGSYMYKLLMNSLYGKFGQNGRVFLDVGKADNNDVKVYKVWDAELKTHRKFRQFAGVIQEESKDSESRDSHPAIAAHVTAYGRVLLWKLIDVAGLGNVFYCDTDSLFVNDIGLKRLDKEIGIELGQLKHEWSSNNVVIRGNKDYQIDGGLKIKGVRKNAQMILWTGPSTGAETFIPIEQIRFDTFMQDRFQSIKGKLREGILSQQKISKITKVYRRQYLKGLVQDDGWISPFDLMECEIVI